MRQRGFTLVEMLITVTLVGAVSLALANFVADWLRTSDLARARTSLLSNAQEALDSITQDIRLSGSADENNRWADPNAPGGSNYGWASNASTLVLARIATTPDREVIFSDPAEYITEKDNVIYYVSGQRLYQRIIASEDSDTSAVSTCPPASATPACPADKMVARDITAFSVAYYDADDQVVDPTNARAIQLSITLSYDKGGETVTADYTTRMVFRNE